MVPWTKGKSGNPKGRPKRNAALTPELRKLLHDRGSGGLTNAETLAQVLLDVAIAGDVSAIRFIFDRIDGKVPDAMELSGADAEPVKFTFEFTTLPDGVEDDGDAGP